MGALKHPDREHAGASPRAASSADWLGDVPAAVVCATCGEADCAGCFESRSRSGVVAIVAWEREGPAVDRLWSTAWSTTREAETFFELLPDGPVLPALGFAFLCELLASAAVVGLVAGLGVAAFPSLLDDVAHDPAFGARALGGLLFAVPALAILLVTAHAAHGAAIDLGARRTGHRGAFTRALRFGLYATGWDLVLGPVGVAFALAKGGPRRVRELFGASVGVPGRSTAAILRGAYGLEGTRAAPARRTALLGAVVATLVATVVILGAATVVLF